RQWLPDRARILIAHDDRPPNDLHEWLSGIGVEYRLPLEQSTEEPAWAVHANESQLTRTVGGSDLGQQFDAVVAFDLFSLTAVSGNRLRNLRADLFPDALRTRCRV